MANPNMHPIHVGNVRSEQGSVTGANTARSSPGATNQVSLFVAGAQGSLIEKVRAISNGAISTATSANVLRLWKLTGSTYKLVREVAIATATPSATAIGGDTGELIVNLRLDATETLTATLHTYAGTQDGYDIDVQGGDF